MNTELKWLAPTLLLLAMILFPPRVRRAEWWDASEAVTVELNRQYFGTVPRYRWILSARYRRFHEGDVTVMHQGRKWLMTEETEDLAPVTLAWQIGVLFVGTVLAARLHGRKVRV